MNLRFTLELEKNSNRFDSGKRIRSTVMILIWWFPLSQFIEF